jgi:hypothetical protein
MLSGFDDRECRMNVGKTLFAQVMEFVPWAVNQLEKSLFLM